MSALLKILGILALACGVFAFFFLLLTQPLVGFLFGLLGIVLGFALYRMGEAYKRPKQKNAFHKDKESSTSTDAAFHR